MLSYIESHVVISEIVEKSKDSADAIKKIMKLKYPNTNNFIEEAHARAFYVSFSLKERTT